MRIFVSCYFVLFLSFFFIPEVTVSPVVQHVSAVQPEPEEIEVLRPSNEGGDKERAASVLLDVPIIKQLPDLYNGCEVTSLSMLLNFAGIPVDKLELAEKVKKDPTPFKGRSLLSISEWGDPNEGFVGDITGKRKGYGVYHGPLFELLKEYANDQAVDLTGEEFTALEWALTNGNPVVIWTTANFSLTNEWVTWKKNDRTIRATFKEHVVLLVGYDNQFVYLNDPLSGNKAMRVERTAFIKSWKQMGSQAVTMMDREEESL
ncbi:C39 family peptidase [Ammoniphilus resinae]|uniref:Uncharacterized protein YvpB n=1 Tax=Ammoniphilus resinae TaxID=861532 RepID=A0ABS4GU14_9BACL|nr:C39 family peptidase [Ammoniphilus resinae]MBP1933612.1 uncharacterized protein YvpB [Ammoniphilus resinae]